MTLATKNVRNTKAQQANTVPVASLTSSDDEQSYNELRFSLSNTLQSTLDLEAILSRFFEHVHATVPCKGMQYENNDSKLSLDFGVASRHSAKYSVAVGNEALGQLSFSRSAPFAEPELAAIEILIGVLFHPLRNALRYRLALENSLIDPLTGLGNRLALDLNITREMKLAKRHKKPLSLFIIDIDHFKSINDKLGHLAGDDALQQVALLISRSLRETDQVFRYGGEEFVAILCEADEEKALLSAERIRKNIEAAQIETRQSSTQLTVSIGLSSLKINEDFTQLFARADKALYCAKNNGRNQSVCSEERTNKMHKIA